MIKILNLYFHKRTLMSMSFDFFAATGIITASIFSEISLTSKIATSLTIIIGSATMFSIGIMIINSSLGFYDKINIQKKPQTIARATLSVFLMIPFSYLMFKISPVKVEDGKNFILMLTIGLIIMLAHRVYAIHGKYKILAPQKILVYGSGELAALVGKSLQDSNPAVKLAGYYASPNEFNRKVSSLIIFPQGNSLTNIVKNEHIDAIIVALSERRGGSMPMRELLDCKLKGVRVIDTATYFELSLGQIKLDAISAGWLIFGEGFNQGFARTFSKRIFDIIFAAILIVLSLPIMLITSLLILLYDGQPIFYTQERVGLNGINFNVIKFRSMITDAEINNKPQWASPGDSRVTRIGKFLRKLRIDELPQLFNVLKGEMSLVGPRPERPYFVEKLTQELPYFAVRQSVKPGITGWAQVRYHYGASIRDSAEKLQYDLFYVKNHSLFLDLVIVFETIGVVLTGKGAQ